VGDLRGRAGAWRQHHRSPLELSLHQRRQETIGRGLPAVSATVGRGDGGWGRTRGNCRPAPSVPAVAPRRGIRDAGEDREPVRPTRRRAAPHPGGDGDLPPPVDRFPGEAPRATRSHHHLFTGHRHHRPRLRAVRAAETAGSLGGRLRPLSPSAGTLLPGDRRVARRVCGDRDPTWRSADDRLRSRLPLARGASNVDLQHGDGDRGEVASQRRHLSDVGIRHRRDAQPSSARRRAAGLRDTPRARRPAGGDGNDFAARAGRRFVRFARLPPHLHPRPPP
jgi:hypothetical protein